MSVTCRLVALRLPAGSGTEGLGRALEAHASSCLTCQAEAARYRRLRRSLAALGQRREPAPPGFVDRVLAALDGDLGAAPPERRRGRVASTAGALAATAAGVAALAWWRRTRPAA
jgi:hypothetical protein